MRKLLIIPFFLAALITTGCKQKTATAGAPPEADSTVVEETETAVPDDSIHTEAYISQRVKHIYDMIYEDYRQDRIGAHRQISTEQFTSAEFNNLLREAQRLVQVETPLEVPGADHDHWVMGQDFDKTLSMEVLSVSDIKATTATAKIRVKNFFETEVTLPLVLENGDWLIDSFVTIDEEDGQPVTFDEKKELKAYIEKKMRN
ncbi:MAG: DUF3828 domain-containing protein [Prevotella sp.]|nr:DUF3828 domain-containing protein [Prevotella sp.]